MSKCMLRAEARGGGWGWGTRAQCWGRTGRVFREDGRKGGLEREKTGVKAGRQPWKSSSSASFKV